MPFSPTEEQRTILSHQITRSARILAGPGTGKSATVVALLDELLIVIYNPPQIKLLTFTRAATAELAHKVSAHPAAVTLRPGTIHSFAISVLLRNPGAGGFPEPLRIADDWESENIVKPTLRNISGFSLKHLKTLIKHMASAWESLNPLDSPDFSIEQRARFLGFWEEHRKIFGYTLLAELPYRLREALQNHHDLSGLELDALIVDEYQDLNACELDVLHRISERGCSVIAAGDDDQSIYSFREAAPEGIRRFRQDYPESEDYTLSVSLRCASNILNWANYVILGDTGRPTDRAVVRACDEAPTGEVALLSFGDQLAEARGVARLVKGIIDQHAIPPSEILVLMRSDYKQAFSNLFRPELESQGITVSDPSAVTEAIAEPANREVIARVHLLCNRMDSLAWATLFRLKKGIGAGFIDSIYSKAREDRVTFAEALTNAAGANFDIIAPASRQRALNLYNEIVQWLDRCPMPDNTPEGNWGKWIISIVEQNPNLEINDYFRQLLLDLDEVLDVDGTLDRYVSQISPIGQDLAQTRSTGIRLMTMTSSKGLTVKATIVVGVEDGLIPHPLAHGSEDRRLLYVAMTRSIDFLYLTWARRRTGPTARLGRQNVRRYRNPSPFLSSGPVTTQDGNCYLQDRFG